jgi:hypothetical protein
VPVIGLEVCWAERLVSSRSVGVREAEGDSDVLEAQRLRQADQHRLGVAFGVGGQLVLAGRLLDVALCQFVERLLGTRTRSACAGSTSRSWSSAC